MLSGDGLLIPAAAASANAGCPLFTETTEQRTQNVTRKIDPTGTGAIMVLWVTWPIDPIARTR